MSKREERNLLQRINRRLKREHSLLRVRVWRGSTRNYSAGDYYLHDLGRNLVLDFKLDLEAFDAKDTG